MEENRNYCGSNPARGGSIYSGRSRGRDEQHENRHVVIATAFGQLMDEGYVDPELATLARKAIANEKNMVMVKRWTDPDQREARLAILESVLNKAPQVAPQSVSE